MPSPPPNVPLKTLGGKQLWGDEYIYGGWRIQRNAFTKHYRLLDDKDVRRAWGTREHCEAALGKAKNSGRASLKAPKLCVLIHGYLRSKDSLKKLSRALVQEGFEVYAINYPSTQGDIRTLCNDTAALLERVSADFEQVNIVTQSLGGIIARGVTAKTPLKGGGRVVMLAPPNQGSRMADLALSWWPSECVIGPAGKQLVTKATAFARNVGTPQSPFMIIAGGRGNARGYNPAIQGDDDGIVSVDETRLDGAAAHHVVRSWHALIMNNDDAIRLTTEFLLQP